MNNLSSKNLSFFLKVETIKKKKNIIGILKIVRVYLMLKNWPDLACGISRGRRQSHRLGGARVTGPFNC